MSEIRRKNLTSLLSSRFQGKQVDMAKALKVAPSQFHQWVKGHRNVGDGAARKIEMAMNLSQGWMDKKQAVDETPQHQTTNKTTQIHRYDAGGRMGVGGIILPGQPGVIESFNVSPEWLRNNIPNATSTANLAIVTGFGDSMRGIYNPGDPLIVDTSVKTLDYDGVYFFRVAEEGYIKRLQRLPGIGIKVISENKAYEDWTITQEMDFAILGRVIKAWNSQEF